MKDALKRKSTIIIGIGFILYVVSIWIPSLTLDQRVGIYGSAYASAYAEQKGLGVPLEAGIATKPLIIVSLFSYVVPVLIGLAEFICAIANKKAVFVLSVIQTVTSVLVFAFTMLVILGAKVDGSLVSQSIVVYFPIVACALLLVGGIVFKKERALNA